MRKTAVLGLFLCFYIVSFSQENKNSQENENKDSITHSVKIASILSVVLPGAGQVYNHLAMPKGQKKAFWKVPLIYAGLGATGYFLLKNNSLKNELRTEYTNRINNNNGLEKYAQYDDQAILTLYDQHLGRRDLFIVGFAFAYILQVVDAAVEAHFVKFDISEDLSLQFEPVLYSYNQPGIKLSLNFVK